MEVIRGIILLFRAKKIVNMKKLFYLFSATLLALTSCTNDYEGSCSVNKNEDPISPPKTDSIPVVVEPILLKKLVYNYVGASSGMTDIAYDGTKVVTDSGEFNRTVYTYTGDVITKMENVYLSGEVYYTEEYFYKDGKIDYVLSKEFGNYYKTKYLYNNDGSVFFSKFDSDSLGNEGDDTGLSGRYVFSGGNLIQKQTYNGSYESFSTYEYDTKNNPRLNVLGSNLLIGLNQLFAANNVIKRTTTATNAGVVTSTGTSNYSYEYDANGYPVKSTETSQISQTGDKITTVISEYTY